MAKQKKIKILINTDGDDTVYDVQVKGDPTAPELHGAVAALARLLARASGRTVTEILNKTMKFAEDGKDA